MSGHSRHIVIIFTEHRATKGKRAAKSRERESLRPRTCQASLNKASYAAAVTEAQLWLVWCYILGWFASTRSSIFISSVTRKRRFFSQVWNDIPQPNFRPAQLEPRWGGYRHWNWVGGGAETWAPVAGDVAWNCLGETWCSLPPLYPNHGSLLCIVCWPGSPHQSASRTRALNNPWRLLWGCMWFQVLGKSNPQCSTGQTSPLPQASPPPQVSPPTQASPPGDPVRKPLCFCSFTIPSRAPLLQALPLPHSVCFSPRHFENLWASLWLQTSCPLPGGPPECTRLNTHPTASSPAGCLCKAPRFPLKSILLRC